MMTQVGSKGGGDKGPDSERNLKIEQTGFPGSWMWSFGLDKLKFRVSIN